MSKQFFENNLRLEDLRLDLNLKQGDVANYLKVKRNTYSKWENCINDMPLEKCIRLAEFYHVSIDYLLGLSNSRERLGNGEANLNKLAQKLLEVRKATSLTQAEVGKKIGFSQRAYSNYETGARKLTTLKLLAIAQFFHISMDYLVGSSSDKDLRKEVSL